MSKLLIIYRAYGGELLPVNFKPLRVPYFSKLKTFKSFVNAFYNKPEVDIKVVWDGPENSLSNVIKQYQNIEFIPVTYQSNKGSLDYCFKLADQLSQNYSFIYFMEDDHAYLPGSYDVLMEGLKSFYPHLISLADHQHRYWSNNGDIIKPDDVYAIRLKHWRVAESTVFSVAMPSETFQKFKNNMIDYNNMGENAMHEREFFRYVIKQGYRLFTPIPGMSAHMVTSDLSPCIDWEKFMNSIVC
jgi:hypothetical protein